MTWLCESGAFLSKEYFPTSLDKNCLICPTCEAEGDQGVTNLTPQSVWGPGGCDLSVYQVGGHVQDGHGDLLLVVIGLPSLVILGERLAGRVSVEVLLRLGQ